jgi:hypothetical protein
MILGCPSALSLGPLRARYAQLEGAADYSVADGSGGRWVAPLIGVRGLAKMLSVETRAHCARGLAGLDRDRRMLSLGKLLEDQHAEVREAARRSWEALAGVTGELLGAMLENRDEERIVRQAAADALGELREARTLDSLLRGYLDIHSEVSQAARLAILRFGPVAVEPLLRHLRSSASQVRPPSAFLDHDVENPGYDAERFAWSVSELLAELRAPAAESLRLLLHDPDESVRRAAEVTLRKMK